MSGQRDECAWAPVSFEEAFTQFVGERAEEGFGEFLRRSPIYRTRYQKTLQEHTAVEEEITKVVGKELVQKYNDLSAVLTGMMQEAGYIMGLKDGLRLASELGLGRDWGAVSFGG